MGNRRLAIGAEIGQFGRVGDHGRTQPRLQLGQYGLGGIDDRDAAAGICGSSVWMPVERMQKLPEGEYYWNEIVGLQVVTEEGRDLGRIEAIFPTGSNDVYVCREGKREILLPAIEEVVRRIDRDRGVMVVRLLKGLIGS